MPFCRSFVAQDGCFIIFSLCFVNFRQIFRVREECFGVVLSVSRFFSPIECGLCGGDFVLLRLSSVLPERGGATLYGVLTALADYSEHLET